MKKFLILFSSLILFFSATAQDAGDEHLLDGTSVTYYYDNGSGVHAEFADGQIQFTWVAGFFKGSGGKAVYRSRKIGDKMYMVNFLVETGGSFVTIVFDFGKYTLSSSALLNSNSPQKQIFFEAGTIKELNLKEK
jgi:MoaF N-terminal domain